jgi:phosphoribosylamine-glycine ligase
MIAVRLSVPPYPEEDVKQKDWGDPIFGITKESIKHIFLCNVFADPEDNFFKVADADGVVLKATAHGARSGNDYVKFARDRVYRTLDNIKCSNKMYRLDIGQRVNGDMQKLIDWGWVQG